MAKVIDVNAETGERIERDFTAEELEQIEIDKAYFAALEAEEAEKLAAKEAALAKLGLTVDELKAILS